LAEETRTLDAKKNEYDLLKSLVDSMEGYPESVKFLHKNTGWNHNAPILSDILYVQEQYRTAVENVLEPYLNYYVVNDLNEGMQAVQLLDDNKKGKANFFLLDKFSKIEQSHQPNGTIKALDVVEIDNQYSNLAQHLLGNVFIAENEDALNDSNGAVVLEKTGKYVKGKYSLTGGSVGLFEGKKIGRAKNLEKLVKEIEAQDKVVNALKADIQQRHNEVIAFNTQLKENAIKQTQDQINQLTNQVFALHNKIENLNHQENTAENRLTDLNKQLEERQNDIAATRDELNSYNKQLEDLQQKMQLVEQDYSSAEKSYNEATAAYNDANLQFTKQQSKISSINQELEFKSNQLNDLSSQIDTSKTQLGEASSSIDEASDNLKQIETLLIELLKNKEADEKKLNEADQE
jgi:chromosome segregation protein